MQQNVLIGICGIIIFSFIIFFSFWFFSQNSNPDSKFIGKKDSFQPLIESMLGADYEEEDDRFIIFTIKNTEEFIQISTKDRHIIVDFPLATPSQKGKEEKIRRAVNKLSLKLIPDPYEETISLDVQIPQDSKHAAKTIVDLFSLIYQTSDNTEFKIEYNGFNFEAGKS